ncbi:hypothetical protein VPH35_044190 [Triticum aestivum]
MMPRQHIGYPVAHRDTGAKGSDGSVSCQDGGVLPITGFPHVGGKAKEGQPFHTTYAFGPRVIVSAVIPSKGALSERIKFVEESRHSRNGGSGSSHSRSFGEPAGDAAAKAKQRRLPKLDSAWRGDVEDASRAVVLATVEDDASGQRSTGAGKEEFLLGEAQVMVAVVLCCRVPWRGGDEEDGALGAGQEVELRGHERRGAKDSGSWREQGREDRRGSGVACRGRSSSGSGGRWPAQQRHGR